MGRPSGETFRVRRIGGCEHGRPRANALLGQATMRIYDKREAIARP